MWVCSNGTRSKIAVLKMTFMSLIFSLALFTPIICIIRYKVLFVKTSWRKWNVTSESRMMLKRNSDSEVCKSSEKKLIYILTHCMYLLLFSFRQRNEKIVKFLLIFIITSFLFFNSIKEIVFRAFWRAK